MTDAPTSDDVGQMYDALTDALAAEFGGHMHVGFWTDEHDDSPVDKATVQLTDLAIERCGVTAEHHVLDVGCGNGIPALHLAAATGARVTGVSVSQHQIDLANASAAAAGVADRVTFQYADAMDLPFPDATFDAALAIESFFHMSDHGKAFDHIARTLRPGGRLVISDFLARQSNLDEETQDFLDTFVALFQGSSLITIEVYAEHLTRTGLHLVEFKDIGENMRRTFDLYADIIKSNETVIEYVGAETAEAMATAFRESGELEELGYALLVARKPLN